jgi:release factor glutamine methyltransferase
MFVLMTVGELYDMVFTSLRKIYDAREASNISDWLFESTLSMKRMDKIMHKNDVVNERLESKIKKQLDELLQHRPLQYVVGESFFYKMRFNVSEHVLIPRPETEELVEWVLSHVATSKIDTPAILDIGTGSGAIAISLKKELPAGSVTGIDISDKALAVAAENAQINNVEVDLKNVDILDEVSWKLLRSFDVIVSNPPYISVNEASSLNKNVLDYEPHQALFVAEDDPLIFYKKIKDFATAHLKPNGSVFFEIHESRGAALVELFEKSMWKTELRQDLHGKDRMVHAQLLE